MALVTGVVPGTQTATPMGGRGWPSGTAKHLSGTSSGAVGRARRSLRRRRRADSRRCLWLRRDLPSSIRPQPRTSQERASLTPLLDAYLEFVAGHRAGRTGAAVSGPLAWRPGTGSRSTASHRCCGPWLDAITTVPTAAIERLDRPDFDRPAVPSAHPVRPHVLCRMTRAAGGRCAASAVSASAQPQRARPRSAPDWWPRPPPAPGRAAAATGTARRGVCWPRPRSCVGRAGERRRPLPAPGGAGRSPPASPILPSPSSGSPPVSIPSAQEGTAEGCRQIQSGAVFGTSNVPGPPVS